MMSASGVLFVAVNGFGRIVEMLNFLYCLAATLAPRFDTTTAQERKGLCVEVGEPTPTRFVSPNPPKPMNDKPYTTVASQFNHSLVAFNLNE